MEILKLALHGSKPRVIVSHSPKTKFPPKVFEITLSTFIPMILSLLGSSSPWQNIPQLLLWHVVAFKHLGWSDSVLFPSFGYHDSTMPA